MNIAKISINRPTLVVVVFTVLIFLGILSFLSLNYELMPKMNAPVISIVTVYPGASPTDVENNVTKKIEDVVSTLENLDNIQSISQEGVSMIIVNLKMSVSKEFIDLAQQDAQRKVDNLKNSLPIGIRDPIISKMSIDEFPIMNLGVTSDLNPTDFFDLLKNRIEPELTRIKGVAQIALIGGSEKEIRVSLKPQKLVTYNISPAEVLRSVQSSNLDYPTGMIKNNDSRIVIRLAAKYKNINDIENVIISDNVQGSPVKLKDIAEVYETEKEITTMARVNGNSSVGISVRKQSDANTVETSDLVKKELKKIENEYKKINLRFSIPNDQADFTKKSADAVMTDLGFAILLVTLVMLLFLHSFRNAFIVMLTVPISLIISFLGMDLLGYTLNMMTLLALSLVIGILVDDAIVVLENIYRHLEIGKNRRDATLDGRMEIGFTAVAITLVDVVVFLPIGLSRSYISQLIGPYALVIVITTLLSLLTAFTVVPLLASRLAKLQHPEYNKMTGRFTILFERWINYFADVLHKILVWAFRHKFLTFSIALLLFIGSIMLIAKGFIGTELAGMGDAGEFIIQIELPKDATLSETNQKVNEIEDILYTKKEVINVYTTVGSLSNIILGALGGAYNAEIDVKLVDKRYRNISSEVYSHLIKNELLSKISGAKIRTAVVNMFAGGSKSGPVQVIVKSTIRDSLYKYANIINDIVEKTPGTIDVKSSLEATNPEISVEINKDKMADLGLSLSSVGVGMQTAFSGNTDSKFTVGSDEYDINIIYDEFNRQSLSDISNLCFKNSSGKQVKLSQFANIKFASGNAKLERFDRTSSITIESQVLGRATGDVGNDIKKEVSALSLPPFISIDYAGQMRVQDEALGNLGIAFIIAIFFVYLIMVALYESYLYPFVVLFSIPLSIIGALVAMALTKTNLSLFTMMGLIMLNGLVAKNAILVVDFTNKLKKDGYRTVRALLMATRIRLRPILMTTFAMIFGLLPIGLATGPASEWKNGLAWVLIGGLTSSMFLSLVIVPIAFLIAETAKGKIKTFFTKFKSFKRA